MRPLLTATAAAALLLLPACRALPAAMRSVLPLTAALPPPGTPAAPLRAVLPDLQAARFAVYLPASLPAPGPGDRYLVTAQASPDTYEMSIHLTNATAPLGGGGTSSWSGFLGLVRGGPAVWVERQAAQDAVLPPARGTPGSLALPGGWTAWRYPSGAVLWQEGGWRYGVSADTPAEAGRIAVSMAEIFGRSGSPLGRGIRGEVVRDFGADGGSSLVLWTIGGYAYEVWGRDAAAFPLLRALVRVEG